MAVIWVDGETTETPDECPNCKHVIECSTVVIDRLATPAVGDYSICFYCYTVLQWDENLKLVLATSPIPLEVALIRQQMRIIRSREQ